jgi:hypothetical protein
MNKTQVHKVDPSPYSNSKANQKAHKSQKSASDKSEQEENGILRSKSALDHKVVNSKKKTLDILKDKMQSQYTSTGKKVFDYTNKLQSKSRTTLRSQSKDVQHSSDNEYLHIGRNMVQNVIDFQNDSLTSKTSQNSKF